MRITMVLQTATPELPAEALKNLARLQPPPVMHEGVEVGDPIRVWFEDNPARLMMEVELRDNPQAQRLKAILDWKPPVSTAYSAEGPVCPVGAERGNHLIGCWGCTCEPRQLAWSEDVEKATAQSREGDMMTKPKRNPVDIARGVLAYDDPSIENVMAMAEALVRYAEADTLYVTTGEQTFELPLPIDTECELTVGGTKLVLTRVRPEAFESSPLAPSDADAEGRWERIGNSMAVRHTTTGVTRRPGDPGYDAARQGAVGWDPQHPAASTTEKRSIHDGHK